MKLTAQDVVELMETSYHPKQQNLVLQDYYQCKVANFKAPAEPSHYADYLSQKHIKLLGLLRSEHTKQAAALEAQRALCMVPHLDSSIAADHRLVYRLRPNSSDEKCRVVPKKPRELVDALTQVPETTAARALLDKYFSYYFYKHAELHPRYSALSVLCRHNKVYRALSTVAAKNSCQEAALAILTRIPYILIKVGDQGDLDIKEFTERNIKKHRASQNDPSARRTFLGGESGVTGYYKLLPPDSKHAGAAGAVTGFISGLAVDLAGF